MSETTDAGTTQNTGTDSILTDGLPAGDASTQTGDQGTQQNTDGTKPNADGTQPDGADPNKTDQDTKEPVVPEAYELKMPEGVELDAKLLEGVTPLFKELKLSNDQAQKIADVFVAHEQAKAQAAVEAFQNKMTEWRGELQSDPEFGGKNFEATKKAAQSVIARYGDEQLKQDLTAYGIGNLPSLVKLLAKAGRGMAEDTMRGGSQQNTEPTRSEKLAAMYPSMNK